MFESLWSGLAQSQEGGMQTALLIDKIARVPISTIVLFALILTGVRLAMFFYLKNKPIHLREGLYSFLKFINDVADALIYAAIVVFMLVRPFGIQTFFIPSQSMVDTLRIGDFIVANKFIYRASEPQPGDIVVFKPPQEAKREGMEDTDFIKRLIGGPGDVIEFDRFQLLRNGKPVEEPYKVLTDPSGMGQNQRNIVPFEGEELENVVDSWDFSIVRMPPKFKFVMHEGKVKPMLYNDDPGPGRPTVTLLAGTGDSQVDLEGVPAQELVNQEPQPIPDGYYLMVGDNRNGSNDGRFWGLIPRSSIIGKAEFVWMPLSRAKNLENSEDYKQD